MRTDVEADPSMRSSRVKRGLASVGLLLAAVTVVVLFARAQEDHVSEQLAGLVGGSKACEELEAEQIRDGFEDLTKGLGLAFAPTARALRRCDFLKGRPRSEVRSIFGPPVERDTTADSWRIGTNPGVIGPEKDLSMTVWYSPKGKVTRVDAQ